MELENSSQDETEETSEKKATMTTVASTYFDQKIAVPRTEGVSTSFIWLEHAKHNPYKPNEISHYQLDQSISIVRAVGW